MDKFHVSQTFCKRFTLLYKVVNEVAEINMSSIYELLQAQKDFGWYLVPLFVNTSINLNDSVAISPVFGNITPLAIFWYPDSALSIRRMRGTFDPNGIRNHSNEPEDVINADNILARSVISTTQNPLAISNEQYHIALSMSCNSSLIKGIGYAINVVNWFTLRL